MLFEAATTGRLPAWAQAGEARRAHMARVAALLGEWADALNLDEGDRVRWRATGWLHDALRDAPPEQLRPLVEPEFRDLPGSFLHGPAAAVRLREEGLEDAELLDALRYHTLGGAPLPKLGLMLIAADFLEPGRPTEPVWRATLRARMPAAAGAVFAEVIAAKLETAVARRQAIRPEMIALWNSLVNGHAALPR